MVARHAQHGGGHADADARLIHHVEHAAQATARLAHQVAHGTAALPVQPRCVGDWEFAFAKIKQGVGRAAPTQLVVQPGQRHVVAHADELAVSVHQMFGHDEERDAACAGDQLTVRAGDFGQHQMDDVLGQLMLARRYPHLVALEAVAWA